jgi:kynureninase
MTVDDARALDTADPLAFARQRFLVPDGIIYLDGNSLGALPAAAPDALARTISDQWGNDLIASWNKHRWIDAPSRIAGKLAPIVGARPDELLIADSTSICLFKLLAAAVRARPGRSTILTEAGNFPTDLYVAQGVTKLWPHLTLRAVATDEIVSAIDEDTAVVTLTHVNYRSGRRHDMAAINAAAREGGALNLWDLSHSAGAIAVDLEAAGCDLAVGCGYKYLNGGPGAPAFVFVARDLQGTLETPVPGWMGHADPFAFVADYAPAAGMLQWLTGTPSILALAALDAGIDTFAGIAMADVEAKGAQLTQSFLDEVEKRCGDQVWLSSPRDPAMRGSQVSFAHPQGFAVMQALIDRGIVGDFRAPDLMRFGFAPLYNSYSDAVGAAEGLTNVLATRAWDQPRFRERRKVT